MKRKLKLYAVTDVQNIENGSIDHKHLFTITDNKKEADLYIMAKLLNDNYTHYSLWCTNHNYKANDLKTWVRYIGTVLTPEDVNRYFIIKLIYTSDQLAELIRYYTRCDSPKTFINNFNKVLD